MAGDPISTVQFTLTRADALVWERTRSRPEPVAIGAFGVWIVVCAAAALLLPAAPPPMGRWTLVALGLVFAAIGSVLVLIGVSFRQWQAAGRIVPRATELTVSVYPDRLDIEGTGQPPSLAFGDIRESLLTGTHLFLDSDRGLVMLPRAAWPDPADTAALAARLAGRRPEPVDADPGPA